MNKQHDFKCLPRLLVKGFSVIAIAFLLAFGLNFGMQKFLDDEIIAVRAAAKQTQDIEEALKSASSADEILRLEAELAAKQAEQYEEFYQQNKNRHCYHYYGQFYEMYTNMYNADTIFIGTSHAVNGVNPLYFEQLMPERSWYNFSLNGANPEYYLDWWEIFLESGYPMPETIIFCVDWFMCDDEWLWRRIDFDTCPDGAVDIMRKIRQSEVKQDSDTPTSSTTDKEQQDSISDLDSMLTYAFRHIPIIYSRDRIPEMIAYYLRGGKYDTDSIADYSELIPTYEHEYLADKDNYITSEFYKGFIPWEQRYSGRRVVDQPCTDKGYQWNALRDLLDIFVENNIHVIFVQVPEYLEGRRTTKMYINNKKLEKIAEDYNITFLNYNGDLAGEINADPNNYSDWGHMNTNGSVSFSTRLSEDLKIYFENLE